MSGPNFLPYPLCGWRDNLYEFCPRHLDEPNMFQLDILVFVITISGSAKSGSYQCFYYGYGSWNIRVSGMSSSPHPDGPALWGVLIGGLWDWAVRVVWKDQTIQINWHILDIVADMMIWHSASFCLPLPWVMGLGGPCYYVIYDDGIDIKWRRAQIWL